MQKAPFDPPGIPPLGPSPFGWSWAEPFAWLKPWGVEFPFSDFSDLGEVQTGPHVDWYPQSILPERKPESRPLYIHSA